MEHAPRIAVCEWVWCGHVRNKGREKKEKRSRKTGKGPGSGKGPERERERKEKGKGKRKGKGKERERERKEKGKGRGKGKGKEGGREKKGMQGEGCEKWWERGGRRRDDRFFCSSLYDNVQTSLPDCSAAPAPLPGAAVLFTFMVVAACTWPGLSHPCVLVCVCSHWVLLLFGFLISFTFFTIVFTFCLLLFPRFFYLFLNVCFHVFPVVAFFITFPLHFVSLRFTLFSHVSLFYRFPVEACKKEQRKNKSKENNWL